MRALTIGRNAFREALHLPVLHVVVVGSAVLMAIVAQLPRFTLSIYDDITMLKDLAVATATLAGMLVAIFAAVHVITAEIENWTVVTVLSKPVRRWEFVVGKYLGVALTVTAVFAMLTVAYVLLVWWGIWESAVDYQGVYPELKRNFWGTAWRSADEMWRGMVFSWLEVLMLSSIAVACCVRAPMIISVVVYFATFVVGHFGEDIAAAVAKSGKVVGGVAAVLVRSVVPDLDSLNFSHEVGAGLLIGPQLMGWGMLYAALYSAAAVLVALMLFRNREVI